MGEFSILTAAPGGGLGVSCEQQSFVINNGGIDMKRQLKLVVGIVALSAAIGCGGTDTTLGGHEDVEPGEGEGGGGGATANSDLPEAQVGGTSAAIDGGRYQALESTVGRETATYLRSFQRNLDVYSYDHPAGYTVTWGEVAPGRVVVLVTASGAPTELPVIDIHEHRTASDVFTAVAPGKVVPDELIELDIRRSQMEPVYQQMAIAADRFPELQEVREASPVEGELQESPAITSEVIGDVDLGQQFEQVGSALTQWECVDYNKPGCGAFPSADWYITQKNRTATATIEKYDQEGVGGMACSQTGTITARAWYDLGTFYAEQQWFSFDLTPGSAVLPYFLQFDGGSTDFWFKMQITGFQSGDMGTQCGYGYND